MRTAAAMRTAAGWYHVMSAVAAVAVALLLKMKPPALAAVLALHPRYTSSRVLVQSACPRSRACFPAQLPARPLAS